MSISRDTFDPAKNYKRVRYHQDRDLLDSELNEQQDIINNERRKLADILFKEGAIVSGFGVTVAANVLTVAEGLVYIDGCLERVPGAVLTYDPAKTSGADYVYVELLKYNYGYNQDAVLINPATGEPTAEREKWVLSLKNHDTSGEALPNNVTQRKVVAVHKFDRETGDVTATVREKSNLYLQDLLGTLPGSRITVASITEDQLAFAAAEGLNSLLQNLAERTYDQAGSYLVKGLDSFIGDNDGQNVEVITNAGRAYIQGFRLQKDLPTTTLVPKSTAVKSVRGEQKTYVVGTRRYALNNTPLKETTQVEAIVEIVSNITRGSVGGGEDLLVPNPVVDIIEVSQGATVFQEGADWQQSGNYVDWLGSGNEPAIGTTYTVRWTYTKQMIEGTDYVDGGWFGRSGHPAADEYFYLVTAQSAAGETQYDSAKVVSRDTPAGEINRLSWLPVSGATGYRIYRGTQNAARADFQRLKDVAAGVTSYTDDGVDVIVGGNPPASNTSGLTMSPVQVEPGNLSIINFGRANIGDEPVAGSNCSIDYDYYVGRRDIIYATTREIKRLEGAPADWPKLPIVPEGTLGLCSVDCPPNSVDLTVQNFGLTRVTMDQIHEIIKDVEDLKYNDAQFQMNNELQNRDAQTKKGVYSDDFSNDAQSDIYHSEWSARIDRVRRFAAPARTASATVLTVNPSASNALFKGSLALLPATERVLVEQTDWSEVKNINPYAVFEKPDASVEITPNIGRRGQTGIAVVGSNFQSNANNVTIRCDGQVVASGVHADTAGRVSASFVIPENARNGNRIVEMTDGLYSARAGIQINDPMVITRIERIVEERIIRVPVVQVVWRTQIVTVRNDPLAQTFSFTEDKVVSGVGLYFTAKDPSIPVTVQIRGVTTGLPNGVIFAEKVLAPGDVSLNVETKVVFANPFYAQAGTSYAVVLLTNSSNYRMRVATLGQLGQNGVITRQTYAAGVLLESSNAETWTPLNGSDLTMKIYGYDFQPSGEVRFQPITGVQFSDLNLDEYSSVPQGTGIAWEYSTDGGVLWDAIVPAEEERLPNLASQVLVRALFSSNAANISPALIHKDVNLIGYLNNPTGTYLNRENELTQGVSSTKIYTQMNIPSGTTINWFASNNGGATWEAMSILTTRKIDEEWTEYTLTRTFSDPNGNRVRYKAEMTGNNLVYPRIHTLGATLS
ncbi:DUF4815 domain-containing protein [Desulforhabdus amnigena]|uniref:DUF4815 domain-containing protein n=1 Tax=Desulforhabdus amnigena TaxID=40218 RepID=A0A9W6FUT2_9BACT|nr:DUF4815 domain-containing protein [Desulforhabdus amnigena]GLI35274.1 hypothetical protein DAMNIGENAA_27070 [Desulforhabdus amnigena]